MNLIDFLFVLQQFRIFIWPSQISSPQNTFQNRKERKTKENKTWEARRSFHTLYHYVVRVKSMIVKYLNFISQGFKIAVFIITLANSPKTNKRTTRKNPIDSLGLKHTKHKPYTWNTSPAKKKKNYCWMAAVYRSIKLTCCKQSVISSTLVGPSAKIFTPRQPEPGLSLHVLMHCSIGIWSSLVMFAGPRTASTPK